MGKQKPKSECPICGKLISNNNLEKHIKSHETHPKYQAQQSGQLQVYHLDHDDLFCKFCGKECKNRNSLIQHEIRCKQNPDKKLSNFSIMHQKGRVPWNKGLTKETDERVKKHAQQVSLFYQKYPEKKTGGYKPGINKGRYKYGTYKGFYCDSSWELAFLVYCIENNIQIERNFESFPYMLNGEQHLYTPDFKINQTYIEIKGHLDDVANIKAAQMLKNNLKYKLLTYVDLKICIDYCKQKYGNKFWEVLYDRTKPSCLDKK